MRANGQTDVDRRTHTLFPTLRGSSCLCEHGEPASLHCVTELQKFLGFGLHLEVSGEGKCRFIIVAFRDDHDEK